MDAKLKEGFEHIKRQQATIDVLLQEGSIKLAKSKPIPTAEWQIEMVYQKEDCSVAFAYGGSKNGESFVDFPIHCHPKSREYLICVRGTVAVKFTGIGINILRTGDHCEVPANVAHATRPLEENSKLIAVCVPYDIGFPNMLQCERNKNDAAT